MKEIIENIKKSTSNINVIRNNHLITPGFPGENLSYTRSFLYNGIFCGISFGYKYVNKIDNDIHYQGHLLKYYLYDTRCSNGGIDRDDTKMKSLEDFIPLANSNSPHWKDFLQREMEELYMPQNYINRILSSDLREPYCDFQVKPLFQSDRFIYTQEMSVYSKTFPIVLGSIADKSFSSLFSSSIRVTGHGDDRHVFYSSSLDVVRLGQWLDENTTGKIYVYGSETSWEVLFFEEKEDAMKFKLMWVKGE